MPHRGNLCEDEGDVSVAGPAMAPVGDHLGEAACVALRRAGIALALVCADHGTIESENVDRVAHRIESTLSCKSRDLNEDLLT